VTLIQTFNLFFYQRIFLRIAIRTRYFYAVFPRAYSKSFLSMLILIIRCILYPGSKLFISTGGKEQSAAIVRAKVEELCRLIPGIYNEINWKPGKSTVSKDAVRYTFKNGSVLQNVAANERSRGLRFHGGLLEECITIDPDILNEVLIPLMKFIPNFEHPSIKKILIQDFFGKLNLSELILLSLTASTYL
jgi:hypothetical protein